VLEGLVKRLGGDVLGLSAAADSTRHVGINSMKVAVVQRGEPRRVPLRVLDEEPLAFPVRPVRPVRVGARLHHDPEGITGTRRESYEAKIVMGPESVERPVCQLPSRRSTDVRTSSSFSSISMTCVGPSTMRQENETGPRPRSTGKFRSTPASSHTAA